MSSSAGGRTPNGFTWIEKPLLAGMARPQSVDDLKWLRKNGVDLVISLTEDPPRKDWLEEAGVLIDHVPVVDMSPPSQSQIDRCLSTIAKANERGMGVAVHCGAGLGRTGVILACYFVTQGLTANNAVAKVRRARPGSVETDDQELAVETFAKRFSTARP